MSNDNFNEAFSNETQKQSTDRLLRFLQPSLKQDTIDDKYKRLLSLTKELTDALDCIESAKYWDWSINLLERAKREIAAQEAQ